MTGRARVRNAVKTDTLFGPAGRGRGTAGKEFDISGSTTRAGLTCGAADDIVQRLDAVGIELAAGVPPDLRERGVLAAAAAIWPRLRNRLKRVGHRDDAGRERDLLAALPVRVARSVPTLVVPADDAEHRG